MNDRLWHLEDNVAAQGFVSFWTRADIEHAVYEAGRVF
jgi:hypothetical protein